MSKEKNNEAVQEALQQLQQGVQEFMTSERFTEYLRVMSKFHNYSFNNTILIALQKPDASLVHGYRAWQRDFGRFVRKGEKGIKIFAPMPMKMPTEHELVDPDTGKPVLYEDGSPVKVESSRVIQRYKVATVFDVSQTEGNPLPTLMNGNLTADVDNYDDLFQVLREVAPVPIRFDNIASDANGYYHHKDKEIVIQMGMSQLQTAKTAIHELSHSVLHDRDQMKAEGIQKSQETKEVEAESIAFIVCHSLGLDTSDYSFPYITSWSSGLDMKELRQSMDTIRKASAELVDKISQKLQLVQEIKDKVQEANTMEDKKVYVPLIVQPRSVAEYHGKLEEYKASYKENIRCRDAIDASIKGGFDGMHLHVDMKSIVDEFGPDRVSHVLATTVRIKDWDGRFSKSNRDWANGITSYADTNYGGYDKRWEYELRSHSAILDGFIGQYRKELQTMDHQPVPEKAQQLTHSRHH